MNNLRGFLTTAICAIAIAIVLSLPRAGLTQDGYTLGVFPFLPPVRLEERYGYFARELSQALGRHVEFRTRSTFEAFREEIEDQTYDIIFVQPFDYIIAADQYGYLPLAKADEPLTAVIMVKQGSELVSLHSLQGKILAMPPMSAAVSRLSQAALSEIGLDVQSDLTMVHYRSHPGCLQAILIGDADACVTNIVPLHVFQTTKDIVFRTLAETRSIPHALFAVHERVPLDDRDIMRRAIIELYDTASGRESLSGSGWSKGFVVAKDSDYDIVRSISAGSD